MLVFIPLLSVFYTIFREFVYLRLKKKAYQTGNKDRNRGIYGGGNCCYRRNVRKRTETFKSSKKMLTRDGKAKEK